MYKKTIVRFGFCDIPVRVADNTIITLTLIIPNITKTSSNMFIIVRFAILNNF